MAADGSVAAPRQGGSAGFHITVFEPSYQERVGWSGAEHGWLRVATASTGKSNRNFTVNASIDQAAISLEPTVSAASWSVGPILE